ncbi:MAG: 2-amino-4-hydroxy-6-hydroxymethyldihydropteridine diphosphokinase [Gammaproteobacteria bacterium]|nr:2-amino-4-hydroxy-6-hydroxymethyldihydropteridine diphosphokinase [Gammaproteobacteria bacterium]MCF6229989.1 2-amino-4-hydroxy-6-hydroxymethyldihydropteridine diphosphokinase [Gammaproteobacteria bacterium]
MSNVFQVFIGLGSNLNQPVEQLKQAVATLTAAANLEGVKLSSFYSGKPMGPQDQPDYVNAVFQMETSLAPRPLLYLLQQVENGQGRIRERRWGERTLDLDILLYGERTVNLPELTIPHIGLSKRNFVLYPLHEIAPDLMIPQLGPLAELITACPQADLQRIEIA